MTDRRHFLKAGGGLVAFVMPMRASRRKPVSLSEARELIRSGGLGPVRFCRVGNPEFLPMVRFVLDGTRAGCIVEVDPAEEGAALLGSHATLVLGRDGYRLFGRNA